MPLLDVRLTASRTVRDVIAYPVLSGGPAASDDGGDDSKIGLLAVSSARVAPALLADARDFLADVEHTGAAGVVHTLPRPSQRPRRVLLVGIGSGGEAAWRPAGAALARGAARETSLAIAVPHDAEPSAVRGLVEGLILGAYRYRLAADDPERAPRLRRVSIIVDDPDRYRDAADRGRVTAEVTCFARDLTNAPSLEKSPAWLADQMARAAEKVRVRARVREPEQLAAEGFGGILAVGNGSARGPRLVELRWAPRGAKTHVVLVGKGITFDTGGICLKPKDGMKLMRKDMGGAASVAAAVLGAARLRLPVRVTALAPLAENMVSGSAYRPGDVVRHYGGMTDEIRNTDAEGRVVLADALSYAARRLAPDALVDLATLTGAANVALGKRTAALYSDNDTLAGALTRAATDAGEQVWRMPLPTDYLDLVRSDIADVNNAPAAGQAGSVTAALFLREFTGAARDRWAHIDMSPPSWTESADAELAKRATGWGVRTLMRWLESLVA